jgi:hypothetical protein
MFSKDMYKTIFKAVAIKTEKSPNIGDKNKQEGDEMTKEELLKSLKAMFNSGEVTAREITDVVGKDDEAEKAKKIVNQLKDMNIEDPITHIKNMQNDQLLTDNFGPRAEDNLVRQYAEQRINAGAKIEDLKSDKIIARLRAEAADYRTEVNEVETDEEPVTVGQRRVIKA